MPDSVTVRLMPLDKVFSATAGQSIQDLLFTHGVEFPCGGRGLCKGCRVRVLSGDAPPTPEDFHKLSSTQIEQRWRLACRLRPTNDLTLELAQWESLILSDDRAFPFIPSEGLGVAVDLGTTTIVAQLVDLTTGNVRGVGTGLNAQAQHGADILSRIEFAMERGGQAQLQNLARAQIGAMITNLMREVPEPEQLKRVVIAGNTAMHHLFCGIDTQPLSTYPFDPITKGRQDFQASELGWDALGGATVHFLPCPGGFVGSDILAGILATGMHRSRELSLLLDLGTNGEIVVGNRDRLVCTSTAAGPAFEGAMISMGMRAATGAICEVCAEEGALTCHVIGGGPAKGICGSGLVDAISAGLQMGWILPRGKLASAPEMALADGVSINQMDVRQLQLAKGAIAAGVSVLLRRWGAEHRDVKTVFLAGAFGNYVNQESARRIGLVEFPPERIAPSGNTALLGAKMALFEAPGFESCDAILGKCEHISLKEDTSFQETYVDAMFFPAANAAGGHGYPARQKP